MTFKPRFTRIQGLSDRRRLPRLGSIRLGIKVKNARDVEYPKETEYFVCPDEVQKIYGAQPYELDVMLPINEIDAVFPTAYKHYGSSRGLKCSGDGEMAFEVDQETREMIERKCPCEKLEGGQCKQSATLMVMLPRVSVGGVYQIRTGSYNSIVDINSGIDYVAALLGRFALVPLKLRREKIETHHDGKKQNHHTLKIIFDADITTLNALRSDTQRVLEHPRYQLPAPVDENPELDPVDIVLDEEDSLDVTSFDKLVETIRRPKGTMTAYLEQSAKELNMTVAELKVRYAGNFREFIKNFNAWAVIQPQSENWWTDDKHWKFLSGEKFISAIKNHAEDLKASDKKIQKAVYDKFCAKNKKEDWPFVKKEPEKPESDRPSLGGDPRYTARNSEDFSGEPINVSSPEEDELIQAKSELNELKKSNMAEVHKAAENLKMAVSPMTLDGCNALIEETKSLL